MAKLKEELEAQRKKFRRIKSDRTNANLFTLDDTYKIDDPLLAPGEREQQKQITAKMNEMTKTGKEAEMVATDTIGELYRNKSTLSGTFQRVIDFVNIDQKA